jgi:hypothetical protein
MEDAVPDTEADARHGLIGQVAHWIAERARASAEMALLSRGDISGMAHDIGVTEADLLDVLPRGVDNTALMEAMIRAHGLDPTDAAHLSAAVMRDLEITCTRCGAVTRCRRELAADTAAARCHQFCGNADTFDALLEDQAKT